MAILVTGGAGYIGSDTCVELLNAGYELIIIDNFSNINPNSLRSIRNITDKDFRFYVIDLLDRNGLENVFSNNEIGAVIHFAGLKAVGESVSIPLYYYQGTMGTALVAFFQSTDESRRQLEPSNRPCGVLVEKNKKPNLLRICRRIRLFCLFWCLTPVKIRLS
ncbi:GDP-mannose 4,6-dehydratase [Neobacillus novalis]|uniref:UDP-glucose 4-epimerase n=1 Tax=Neobacillus novalis TaxID=220687 RepID=A0AA95MT23_9BACI|nr:SDR family NAD(P)-dependent oxidoreductase [Neobacillus novalis]WHY86043.1 GDP-mannose 4,6-dehydratase [Neobacillus novalis]